ncbi:YceI family protein [Planobacterium oryzisoli]|uniref:Polyisoprenoid-binding protein n=1 Tax=Planobacterium oryzisoli TaxID=2771435 RepID=A0A930YUA2_9FLAO|nr:YceI family protein [Planobacterium oryzisoli]MBF5026494.1 polyisoprenoid-binding protein [Planobacterium oryzisoli]
MATKWTLDNAHSEITFKVRHMMISNVKGEFTDFHVDLISEDENFQNVQAKAVIKSDSINTKNADRDNHLKNSDFFNTEKNPEIVFVANSLNEEVTGDITINGVTRPITLDVEFGGVNVDPWGNTKAGFSFEGKLKRSDFGLNWNAALEAGGVMLSDDVKIAGELQFIKA